MGVNVAATAKRPQVAEVVRAAVLQFYHVVNFQSPSLAAVWILAAPTVAVEYLPADMAPLSGAGVDAAAGHKVLWINV